MGLAWGTASICALTWKAYRDGELKDVDPQLPEKPPLAGLGV